MTLKKEITTPALLLSLDILEENILKMASLAKKHKISVRPHTKTHNCPPIAGLQVAAGASGIACYTVEEALLLDRHSIENILVTEPITASDKVEKIIQLNEDIESLTLTVSNKDGVDLLSEIESYKSPIKTLLSINTCKIPPMQELIALASAIKVSSALVFAGIQVHTNKPLLSLSYEERKKKLKEQAKNIRLIKSALEKEGFSCETITGGETETLSIDLEEGVLTETQAGSYPFMDKRLDELELKKEGFLPFRPSLFLLTSITSLKDGEVLTDVGTSPSSIGRDKPFALGDKIILLPEECKKTIQDFKVFHCTREEELVCTWPIQAVRRI